MSHNYEWHRAINDFNTNRENFVSWMYDALTCTNEIPRLARLFKSEREGTLAKIHQQCSRSEPVELKENYLTCCIGSICSKCPYLKALEKKLTGEELDNAKAWTCAVHILKQPRGTIDSSEGFILTEDDKLYWKNVYASMSTEVEDVDS